MRKKNFNRSRSYYRHQRLRVIAKKVYIYTVAWGNDLNFAEGIYAKGKVHCSCKMCKYEKHYGIEKLKVQAKLLAMQEEMDEFWETDCHP